MIYNEDGITCKVIGKEVVLEGLTNDIIKKNKMIEALTNEIINNTSEIKKIESFDIKALAKAKRNVRLIGLINEVFMSMAILGGTVGIIASIIGFLNKTFIPAIISFAAIIIGAFGIGKTNPVYDKLKQDLAGQMEKLIEVLENNISDLTPEMVDQINKLKSQKLELENMKIKKSQNDDRIDKGVSKYVKQYNLDKKLVEYLKSNSWYNYGNEWDPVSIKDYLDANNENEDGGVFIGLVLSAKQVGTFVEAECIIFGKDDSFYTGDQYTMYYEFIDTNNRKFNIVMDDKSVYDYREEDYVVNSDAPNGNGRYKILFDLSNSGVKLTRGSIFYYYCGF